MRYEQAIANGLMSKENQEKLERGESFKYQTPYGEGFFSLRDVEESRKYGLIFEQGINVSEKALNINLLFEAVDPAFFLFLNKTLTLLKHN